MKLIIISTLFIFTTPSFAQMAAGSIFKDMMSINPAVIHERPAATFSLKARHDQVKKNQDVNDGAFDSSTTDATITNGTFFYGGKGGHGLTTEVRAEYGTGSMTEKVTGGASGDTTIKSDATMNMVNIGISIWDFIGIGYTRVGDSRTIQTTGGTDGNKKQSGSTTLSAYTVGVKMNLGLDFGLLYQHTSVAGLQLPRAGAGIGLKNKAFHFEVGYMKDLKESKETVGGGTGADDPDAYKTYNPSMFFGTAEVKFGKLAIGVTSKYLMEGYFEYKNLLYYSLILSKNKANRIENSFNFSLGGDKGSSFSGSLTYSTDQSEETPPVEMGGQKYKTNTTIMGAEVSYTYSF